MRPVPALPPLPTLPTLLAETCQSWDVATRAHNSHKASQGIWLQTGSTLFEEEVDLLGDIAGQTLLHACCNSGQDTISLNLRHGASCTGVDFSGEAIATARALAQESGASVSFVHDELVHYLETTESRFDLAFGSYGFLPWIHDLPSLARGFHRVLHPGSRLVLLEFHPLAWSFDQDYRLQDPYFAPGRFFSDPVSDYVAAAEGALSPSGHVEGDNSYVNPHRAHSVQHTVADILSAFLEEGFRLETFREWPWSNGCRIHAGLVPKGTSGMDARRFTTPAHVPNLPWMLGLSLRRS